MKFDSVTRENTLFKRDSVLLKGTLDYGFISRKLGRLFSKYDRRRGILDFWPLDLKWTAKIIRWRRKRTGRWER
jgi:hypothetical protein